MNDPRPVLENYFPLERMQILQDLFARTHQVGVVITDLEGNWITRMSNASSLCQALQASELVRERCDMTYRVVGETVLKSGKPVWQECHNCGFVEAGIPLWVAGQHVANCLIGQTNSLNVNRQRIEEYAWSVNVDVLQVRNAYSAMSKQPVEQFIKSLDLFSVYTSEVLEQACLTYQLSAEVNRLRQVEVNLRQEGLGLMQASTTLRESISRVAYDLQEVLRAVSPLTDEHDQLKLGDSQDQAQQIVELIQKIRRAYRTVLDGIALEQSQRVEMEQVLFDTSLGGLHRLRMSRRRGTNGTGPLESGE
jgi:ligand-binding sensor protein